MKYSEIQQNKIISNSYSTKYENIQEHTYITQEYFSSKEFENNILNKNNIYTLGSFKSYSKKKMTFANKKVLFKYYVKLEFSKE